MKRVLPILLFLFLLSACAPDPRKEAQAEQIRAEAEQAALNEEQSRKQAQELHELYMQQEAMNHENARAAQAQWQTAVDRAIWIGSLTLMVTVCYSVISVGRTVNKTVEGVGAALVRRADVAANLIRLDPVTRQYPLLVQHVHGSKYAAHNPNTGSVMMLDERNEADRQLIATSGATQIAGVIAQEARQSNDPAGVAVVRPPVVGAEERGLVVSGRGKHE